MIVNFEVSCFGYFVGGHKQSFEIEIEDCELEGMTEEQKQIYISNEIELYIRENIEFSFDM